MSNIKHIKYIPAVQSLAAMILDQEAAARRAKRRLYHKHFRSWTNAERIIQNMIYFDYNGTWRYYQHLVRGPLRYARKPIWDPILEILKADPRIIVTRNQTPGFGKGRPGWQISVNHANIQ